MVRLSEDDSVPRVENASERHLRLCKAVKNTEKYQNNILPSYNDLKAKQVAHGAAMAESTGAQDAVWLNDQSLDDILRDLHGRAKEYDRNHPGSNITVILFPGGTLTSTISMPDREEPDAAHLIALKIISLGEEHPLYPLAATIETAVSNCRTAFANLSGALKTEGEANLALTLAKVALVRKYNANYFIAASDVDKAFAEKLFPMIRYVKRKNPQPIPVNAH